VQSKANSLVESITNTAVGFLIAMWSQILIYPFFGIHISHATNLKLTIVFTFISIARGYILRRLFNRGFTWVAFFSRLTDSFMVIGRRLTGQSTTTSADGQPSVRPWELS
jgi:hypothetical protein